MTNVHRLNRPCNPTHTEDLLHMVAVMVRKAEREPKTADTALSHAKRAFDRLVERLA